ncbi:PaRep2b protein [Pyrobaculum aerophilum]|nr:PaRep2b protein [Pyrobaculum aerophilum]
MWDDLSLLAEAEAEAKKMAREVTNKLNAIASRLERAGYSSIAERLKAATENVIRLAEATQDDLRDIDATRGERAVAALLSLVTSDLFGVSVERALAERGKYTAGVFSIVSAVRSAPFGFYDVFSSISGDEKPSEAKKLAFRIATLLTEPAMRAVLAGRQGVEVRVEQKTENGKRRVYVTFAEESNRELLKAPWDADSGLKPLWAEGEVVKPIKEIANLAAAASSGSKPLDELNEEAWKRVVETAERVKEAIETTTRAVAIGALPTDAVLYPGSKHARGLSSYLSQTFTYWALAEGGIELEKVYPSEEGLKPVWRVESEYTRTVEEVLIAGRTALEELLKSRVNLKATLTDVKMNDELKTALETATGEFWSRVNGLFSRWKQLEEEAKEKKGEERKKVIDEIDKLGKYLRVLLPLAHAVEAYRRGELSREEAALAVIYAVLYDGVVLRDEILLYVGGPEKEEEPIMTHDHFTVFWLWALRELGFKPSSVRKGRGTHLIVFRGAELNELVKVLVPMLPALHGLRDALAEFADAFEVVTREVIRAKFGIDWAYNIRNENFFKKLEEIITMAEDYIYRNVTVERGPLDTSGQLPKTAIRFKLGDEEVAYINMYWTGNKLLAQFTGSRESAERLASIIRALGGNAEIRRMGRGWSIQLTTDGIIAIRHGSWLNAVRGFVDELYSKGLIDKDRYEQLVKEIEAGPNVAKFAGVEFSVNYRTDKTTQIVVEYQPTSDVSKNIAVSTLKARGLEEGVHFTVKEYGGYEIRVTKEAYSKAVEALAQSRLKEKEDYAVYDKWRIIRVKKDHKDAVVNALKTAGLEEGRHFTVKWSGRYVIHITYDGLYEIQRMALKGDLEAERFIRDLEDVLKRRYGDDAVKKLIEALTPAREEGAVDLPLTVYDDKGNIVARVIDLRYEFVENGQPVNHCAGEDCRLRIIAEYEAGGDRRQLKMEWYWRRRQKQKGNTTTTYYFEMAIVTVKNEVEAAVLKALTGKAKKGQVWLYADQLDALRRFKPLKDAVDQWRGGGPK